MSQAYSLLEHVPPDACRGALAGNSRLARGPAELVSAGRVVGLSGLAPLGRPHLTAIGGRWNWKAIRRLHCLPSEGGCRLLSVLGAGEYPPRWRLLLQDSSWVLHSSVALAA